MKLPKTNGEKSPKNTGRTGGKNGLMDRSQAVNYCDFGSILRRGLIQLTLDRQGKKCIVKIKRRKTLQIARR